MKLHEVKPNIFFVDGPGPASNSLLLKTSAGNVLVDTMSSEADAQAILDAANLTSDDIDLLLTTHADGDHMLGNSLFNCPNIAHQLTHDRMVEAGRPAAELPTETFTGNKHSLHHGEFTIEMIFTGGHKKDMTMIWLPEQKVLFASDIIFTGRYPVMIGSIVPTWIEVLKSLPEYQADVYLPGHGTVCTLADVDFLLDYMEPTWEQVNELVKQGKTLDEILAAPGFPKVDTWDKESFFEKNIQYMVEMLT